MSSTGYGNDRAGDRPWTPVPKSGSLDINLER